MLIGRSYTQLCSKSLELGDGRSIVEPKFAITVQNLKSTISLYPSRSIGIEKSCCMSICNLAAIAKTNGSVNAVERNVSLVEHEIALSLLIELGSDVQRRHDHVASLLPGSALSACVHNGLDERESYFIDASCL